jgi:hypothetical protein
VVPPVAVNVADPLHKLLPPLTPMDGMVVFTLTVTVAMPLQTPEVPVMVYVVVEVRVEVTLLPVVADKPVPGTQV